jgi:hypothetical protein
VGAVAAAAYAPLAVGDEFEELVASRLGLDPEDAAAFLSLARAEYGETKYSAHAARFALAYQWPSSWVAPDGLRRAAAEALLNPMLSPPAANLAYGLGGRDPRQASCAGLIRRS